MAASFLAAPRRAFLRYASILVGSAAVPAAAYPARASREAEPMATPRRIELLETFVAGTAYHRAAEVRAALRETQPLTLERQPDNRFDERAIEVYSAGGAKLGYVPRMSNEVLASLMDAGKRLTAIITAIDDRRIPGEVEIEMRVFLLE